jgi:hypothetical protein
MPDRAERSANQKIQFKYYAVFDAAVTFDPASSRAILWLNPITIDFR